METKLTEETRVESDLIGAREIPAAALYGVQTLRGIENFPISKFHLESCLQETVRDVHRSRFPGKPAQWHLFVLQ